MKIINKIYSLLAYTTDFEQKIKKDEKSALK